MQRRVFVTSAVAAAAAAVSGLAWRAYDTGVFGVGHGPAFEPWNDWRGAPDEGALALVRSAILASNPFNTQPWLFRVDASSIEVYADNTRNTGAFDPYLRELRIGLGCAIENLMLAAAANGYRARLTIQPGVLDGPTGRPDRELVARVDLERGERSPSELYDAIPHRHTNRYPFDSSRPVPADFVVALANLSDQPDVAIRLFTSDTDKARFVDMCTAAVFGDLGNSDARLGTARWTRSWKTVQRLHDGTSIDDAGLPPLRVAAMKFWPRLFQGGPPPDITKAIKGGYTDLLLTGRLFGLIAVRDLYDQAQSMQAGRLWQRAHLLATARGLAARPANQPVQLVDHQRMHGQPPKEVESLAVLTGDAAWRPTFMFYMGYPTRRANPSARRGLGEVLI
jgi:hypothetical protein